ncbi:MAG: hypothetical protein ABR607_03940 [Pyrinomonadaceae bacterium]
MLDEYYCVILFGIPAEQFGCTDISILMRWKLLLTTSVIAGLAGFLLWCALAIGVFGSARVLARNDGVLLASIAIPLAVAGVGGLFAYRHTARRRKIQALVTTLLAIFLTLVVYLAASIFAVDRLYIPRTYEVRHGR